MAPQRIAKVATVHRFVKELPLQRLTQGFPVVSQLVPRATRPARTQGAASRLRAGRAFGAEAPIVLVCRGENP
eukprot:11200595-Lingulodinium_polyedra.AAC.1